MLTDLLANLLHEWEDEETGEPEAAAAEAVEAELEPAADAHGEEEGSGPSRDREGAVVEPGAEQHPTVDEPELPEPTRVVPEPPPPPVSARRESILRLLAAMYPEAAHRIPGAAAAAVAAPRADRGGASGFVVFHLGGESFGVPLRHVLEVDRLPEPTPVPFVPDFVRGVTNRRGEVLPLVDLRVLLGLEPSARLRERRMLVVRRGDSEAAAALVVDGLGGIAWLTPARGAPPEGPLASKIGDLLSGAGTHRDATIHLVDVEGLFGRLEREELSV
jgi:purine-binding chemotaxis protein CheW